MFLVVAMYFENRFDFYDLVIKRGVMLVVTIVALGLLFTARAAAVVEILPAGPVRPWLMAIVADAGGDGAARGCRRRCRSGLDRLWFGRSSPPWRR